MKKTLLVLATILTLAIFAAAQVNTFCAANLACSISGAWTDSAQFASTVSTGTAPFSIASTTVVTNLNSQFHNGLTAPGSAIVGVSDTQTLTAKTLTAPAITNPTITGGGSWAGSPSITTPTVTSGTIDGFAFSHTALQVSAATNYGVALGTQTVVSSLPTTGPVSVYFLIVVATAGSGCGAGTNSVTVNPLTWTAPGGTVENINPSSNMGISANGTLDQGASTFGSTAFTNNGIQAIVAKSGTAITYVTTSSLGSAGCSTVPQYQVYARAFF